MNKSEIAIPLTADLFTGLPDHVPAHIFEFNTLWDGSKALDFECYRVGIGIVGEIVKIFVEAPFFGDSAPEKPVGSCWELWDYEVVELFLMGKDNKYIELEFGPHGHYLCLQLHGSRNIVAKEIPLEFTVSKTKKQWRGVASFPLSLLPSGTLTGNAYAIHGQGENRRYLAWAKGTGTPDFHQLASFKKIELFQQ